jgi:hypothetical protein
LARIAQFALRHGHVAQLERCPEAHTRIVRLASQRHRFVKRQLRLCSVPSDQRGVRVVEPCLWVERVETRRTLTLLALFRCIRFTAHGLFSFENVAHASRILSEAFVLDRQRCHTRVTNAVLATIGRRRPAHDFAKDLEEPGLPLLLPHRSPAPLR